MSFKLPTPITWKKEKTLQKPAGSFYILIKGQKAKGEEKPEEELMGKRKSSPRLATTPSNRCC
ncbi:hypothetical protein C0966_03245 [Bacillus methanolicus]|nr:hypothetical protein [Bacillus methanolicus]